eukprot:126693-Pelagomonas_calceolata.AAC.1
MGCQDTVVAAASISQPDSVNGISVYIGNLQPNSLADRLLMKHSQPASTSLTTRKQDKSLQVFVPSTHQRTIGT